VTPRIVGVHHHKGDTSVGILSGGPNTGMHILIIYDSVFGNTERIARSIGETIGSGSSVEVLRPDDVKLEHMAGLRLLIVGSPTRAFRPTAPVKKFLKGIPRNGLLGVKVAAFDTRISAEDIKSSIGRFFVKRFGYAAGPVIKGLRKKGGEPVLPPEGFFVDGSEGPLKNGELERAADWARKIAKMGR
jgi:flavodoxin I